MKGHSVVLYIYIIIILIIRRILSRYLVDERLVIRRLYLKLEIIIILYIILGDILQCTLLH